MSASNDDRAGDLLIQEVEEELRHEQYKRLWAQYGGWMVGAALLLIVAVAGWQGWQHWQSQLRQKEAAQFAAAEDLATQGKAKDATAALDKLAADSHTGYAILAKMREAELLLQGGGATAARHAYEQLAASSAPALYRDLATLKGAMLAADQGDTAAAETALAGLTAATNPWHYAALETLASVALKKGDRARAADLYKQLADDLQAPQGVRARAAELRAALQPGDKAKG